MVPSFPLLHQLFSGDKCPKNSSKNENGPNNAHGIAGHAVRPSYRGTSPIRSSPPPPGHHLALDIILR